MSVGLDVVFNDQPWIRKRYAGVVEHRPATAQDLCSHNVGTVNFTVGAINESATFDQTYFSEPTHQTWANLNPYATMCLDCFIMRRTIEKISMFKQFQPVSFDVITMRAYLQNRILTEDIGVMVPDAETGTAETLQAGDWWMEELDVEDDARTLISTAHMTLIRWGEWDCVGITGTLIPSFS